MVIIGMLTGAFFAAQEIILSAKVRAQARQIEELNSAVASFIDKFNCLPGDCVNAESYSLGTDGDYGNNGNGSKIIGDASVSPPDKDEQTNFWYHLSTAGLLDKTYTPGLAIGISTPATKMPTDGGVTAGVYIWGKDYLGNLNMSAVKNAWSIAASDNSGAFHPKIAYLFDSKIDDGMPQAGNVQASGPMQTTICVGMICADYAGEFSTTNGTGDSSACIDDTSYTTPEYNLDAPSPGQATRCALVIKTGF